MAFIAANISLYAELRLNGPGRHPAGCDTVESLEQACDAAIRLVDTPAVARVAVDVVEAMEGRLLDTPATILLGPIARDHLDRLNGMRRQIDPRSLTYDTENCGKVIHTRISAFRRNAIQTLAGRLGYCGKRSVNDGGSHQLAQDEACAFRIIVEKDVRCSVQYAPPFRCWPATLFSTVNREKW